MQERRTTSETIRETFVKFLAAVTSSLPRDLSPEVERYWADHPGELSNILQSVLAPKDQKNTEPPEIAPALVSTLPVDGVEFVLTLDFDRTDPLDMLRSDGYNSRGLKHKGNRPKGGIQTRRFRLVSVGDKPNLDAVRSALIAHGTVPEGQWREAFKITYPTPDVRGLKIGFADPSWVQRGDGHLFPCLFEDGSRWHSRFYSPDLQMPSYWRWLVACK